jgi:hypothetical protein
MSDDANAKDAAGQAPKKVVVQSPASSSIKPSSVTQIAPAVGADAPAAAPVADGRRTIKLKPMKAAGEAQSEDETVSMDRESLEPGVIPADAKDEDAATVKIEKPSKSAAAVKPVVPGAKQTIKLRPSAGTVQTPQAEDQPEPTKAGASTIKVKPPVAEDATADVQQTKKTIRLVPKKAEPAKPSDPTTKLEDDEQTAALTKPSAVTAKLPPESPGAAEAEDVDATIPDSSGASSKKTLKLRTTKLKAPTHESSSAASGGSEDPGDTDTGMEAVTAAPRMAPMASGAAGADEGHIAFAIAAIVALLLMAYFTWMTLGQFGEQYLEWQSANVPALSGSVK